MFDNDNQDLNDFYQQIAKEAAARAAIEIVTWIPLALGDHACGKVVDNGTIELPSLRVPNEMEVWPVSVIAPIGEIVMNCDVLDLTEKVLRVAWLGPVLLRQYQTTRPDIGDVVAMHYQRDETPKSGLNDYKLVNSVVFDGKTGQPKKPVQLDGVRLALPPSTILVPSTGELKTTFPPFDETNEKLGERVKTTKK